MTDLREEQTADRPGIRRTVAAAFGQPDEADLIERLRADGDVRISLVAIDGDTIVGHVLFSAMTAPFRALALAPVSVMPGRQRSGIGSDLIRAGLGIAERDGWQGVFVLGEPAYYRRFGFDPDLARGFDSPYQGPWLMLRPLGGPLPVSNGAVAHARAFAALGQARTALGTGGISSNICASAPAQMDAHMDEIVIRDCTDQDMTAVTAIYRHAVLHGTATFEIEPPDEAEMQSRRSALVASGYPYLVAEAAGEIVGYAYCGVYRARPAYRGTTENSVYVHPDWHGRGVGRRLLAATIERAEAAGLRQMIAVIGDSGNTASIGLHRSLGFVQAGVLRSVGWKHGRWLDSVLMQRPLGPGDSTPR